MKRFKEWLIRGMTSRMLSCDEASYWTSYRSDHRLRFPEWFRLKMHLINCHLCRKYSSQIEQLNQAVSAYEDECLEGHMSKHLSGESRLGLQKKVENEMNVN